MALSVGVCTHLSQCHLGRGLPPYQVASWSIQPFCHNRQAPKIGGGAAVPTLGGAGSHLTQWPGPSPTSIPIGILIHPTVWPQYTNVTRQTHIDRQQYDSIRRTILQTVTQKLQGQKCNNKDAKKKNNKVTKYKIHYRPNHHDHCGMILFKTIQSKIWFNLYSIT